MVDWEAELALVIGTETRHASAAEASAAIAGYCILNDLTARDWQRRTSQFLAGKTFEGLTPVGPELVSADEVGDGRGLAIGCEVAGEVKQAGNTSELVFGPVDLVQDLSKTITLEVGDIIATGTPGGVGFARDPQEFLRPGSVVRTTIQGLGELRNTCR